MLDLESLFKLSYGMCILSSRDGDRINGCIVNTVFQLTPEPPMVAVSVNKACLTHEFVESSGVFGVSILSEKAPTSLIGRFGFRTGRELDKFGHVRYRTGQMGAAIVLDNTAAFLEAEVTESVDVGSHTLFIGRVVACETLDDGAYPMTYAYYRDVKHGRTPKSAATYIEVRGKKRIAKGEKGMKYKCIMCGYIYDPVVGDTENGVEPGTEFADLPEDWVCPECGAGKDQFEPVEDED